VDKEIERRKRMTMDGARLCLQGAAVNLQYGMGKDARFLDFSMS
jgi:hypothetical protein